MRCARDDAHKEAIHLDLGVGVELVLQQLFLVRVVARVDRLGAVLEFVERGTAR